MNMLAIATAIVSALEVISVRLHRLNRIWMRASAMPSLKHDNRPERILPIAPTGQMFIEMPTYISDIEQSAHFKRTFG